TDRGESQSVSPEICLLPSPGRFFHWASKLQLESDILFASMKLATVDQTTEPLLDYAQTDLQALASIFFHQAERCSLGQVERDLSRFVCRLARLGDDFRGTDD